jgi:hypothetical protein
MRTFRNLCAAAVLIFVLASSAAAGTMWPGVVSPTPTPEPSQSASMTADQTGTVQADGTIHPGVAGLEPAAGAVAEIAQTLLQSALALF